MSRDSKSVEQMIHDTAPNKRAAEEEIRRLHAKRFSKYLKVARMKAGMNQAEVAEKMGITQSAVAKLEKKSMDDFKFSELNQYLSVVDANVEVSFGSPRNLAQRMQDKFEQLMAINKEIEALCKGDTKMHLKHMRGQLDQAESQLNDIRTKMDKYLDKVPVSEPPVFPSKESVSLSSPEKLPLQA